MKKNRFYILSAFILSILIVFNTNITQADIQNYKISISDIGYDSNLDLYGNPVSDAIDNNEHNLTASRCSIPEPGTFLFLAMGSIMILRNRKART